MSKKRIKKNIEADQNPFALSTGDMMSGLMFIFILLLSALMMQIQNQREKTKNQIEDYNRIRQEIYIDLKKEFSVKVIDDLYIDGMRKLIQQNLASDSKNNLLYLITIKLI